MKKILTFIAALMAAMTMNAQGADVFKPYKTTNLRMPSVPLFVNDPYFSIWSPYDRLNDGTTRHWSNAEKPIEGLLRVDGTTYRFLGADQKYVLGDPLMAMADEEEWTGRVSYNVQNGTEWTQIGFDDSSWQTQPGAFGSPGEYPNVRTRWEGSNTDIYVRRTMTLTAEDLKKDLYAVFSHDDVFEMYINGVRVVSTGETWLQGETKQLSDEVKNALVEGTNVVAAHCHNTSGGAYIDFGIFVNLKGLVWGKTLLPMANEGEWKAQSSFTKQNNLDWTTTTFGESGWRERPGAFGTASEYPNVRTAWTATNSDVYVRRRMVLSEEDLTKDLYAVFSHDDVFELYINGVQVVATGETWLQGEVIKLSEEVKSALVVGTNIVAAHCHNTTGGAYLDFGIFENTNPNAKAANIQIATQKSFDIMATSSYYTFGCGPVELDVVFTAPMLYNDLEQLSTPINYMSYQVRSTDGKEHNVQLYFGVNAMMAVNTGNETTISNTVTTNGNKYLRTGNKTQDYLHHDNSDLICIDWGYFYLSGKNGDLSLTKDFNASATFATTGKLPAHSRSVNATKQANYPTLTYLHDFGNVDNAASYLMVGYDEVWDMQYFGKDYKGYWARNGKTIFQAFEEMSANYDDIMMRCKWVDQRIYDDGIKAGNEKYAELLAASYRQCIAAHKVFEDEHGHILFFSKENNSGGFVNTLDVTYPSEPLFLMYNLDLAKGMITSIFEYCESDRWGFNFACHDIGHYPRANGQHYSITSPDSNGGFAGNMPIEETGNMITLTATITMLEGNADYASEHWDILKTWVDYLVENGQDPENQLCTDDFAGHLAHNANLSLKAIMGVLGFSEIARIKGETALAQQYRTKAEQMIQQWERDDLDSSGDHYSLTLDGDGTWSQKYNLVWDKLWQTNIAPSSIMQREFSYYLTKQNTYGLPLDSRRAYTKSDWIIWTASMAPDTETFTKFSDLVYKYVNETPTRIPLCDWYYTTNATQAGFRARSVVGGHWFKVLMDTFDPNTPHSTSIGKVPFVDETRRETMRYNAQGLQLLAPAKGLNIVKYSNGETQKVMVR